VAPSLPELFGFGATSRKALLLRLLQQQQPWCVGGARFFERARSLLIRIKQL